MFDGPTWYSALEQLLVMRYSLMSMVGNEGLVGSWSGVGGVTGLEKKRRGKEEMRDERNERVERYGKILL